MGQNINLGEKKLMVGCISLCCLMARYISNVTAAAVDDDDDDDKNDDIVVNDNDSDNNSSNINDCSDNTRKM